MIVIGLLAFQMTMDGITMLLMIMSTWQSFSAVPSCSEDDRVSQDWLSWQWLSVKLMWGVMVPIFLGMWHKIAILLATEDAAIRFTNLEQNVSLKAEVAKNWRARLLS